MSHAGNARTGLTELPGGARAERRDRVVRPLLMLGGVAVLVIAGAVLWLRGGGTVTIDDAYVRAAKLAISTDVSGIVAAVDVREGQVVRRGDPLFRLDDRPFRIALAGARASLAQTSLDVAAIKQDYERAVRDAQASDAQLQSDRADLARFAGLVGSGAVTRAETDQARYKVAADLARLGALHAQGQVLLARLGGGAGVDATQTPGYLQAEARVDEAQRQLDHTVVRAPFDGVVTEVASVQPGMYLAAATPAFALVSNQQLWAEGNPKETELTWIVPGAHVDVGVDSYPSHSWTGVVESISPASGSEFSVLPAQNTSGNWVKVVQRFPLRVRLDPQPGAPTLRAGMTATLKIETGHRRVLADLWP